MIKKMAMAISDWLIKSHVINSNDESLYFYAAYSLLFGMLPVFLAILYGVIMGMLMESILMIIPFMLIRKFSGGFHLISPKTCFFASSTIIVISLIAIRLVLRCDNQIPVSVVVAVSTAIIFICSPIDSDARKLSSRELKVFGAVARFLAILFASVYYLLLLSKNKSFAVPIGVGTAIPALLQIPCFFIKRK